MLHLFFLILKFMVNIWELDPARHCRYLPFLAPDDWPCPSGAPAPPKGIKGSLLGPPWMHPPSPAPPVPVTPLTLLSACPQQPKSQATSLGSSSVLLCSISGLPVFLPHRFPVSWFSVHFTWLPLRLPVSSSSAPSTSGGGPWVVSPRHKVSNHEAVNSHFLLLTAPGNL